MMNSIIKSKKTFYILGISFIFLFWFLMSICFDNDYVVPSVSKTLLALKSILLEGYTYQVLGKTILRLFITVSICFILGVGLAVLSNTFYRFKAFAKPIIVLFKTLPLAVVIIALLIVFEREMAPYFIAGVVIFPLIYEATITGLDHLDSNIKDEVKMLSKTNITVIKKIYLPLTFPYLLTSLIQSLGLGLKVMVMAEFITEPKYSIGTELVLYKDEVMMEYVYAWSIILIFLVLLFEALIYYFSKRFDIK